MWCEGGGVSGSVGGATIKATTVCYRLQTQGPRPSVSPNHRISQAPAESLVHWRRNIWSVLFTRINSHTNDRSTRGRVGARKRKWEGGGGGRGSERAIMRESRDKTKAALDLAEWTTVAAPRSATQLCCYVLRFEFNGINIWPWSIWFVLWKLVRFVVLLLAASSLECFNFYNPAFQDYKKTFF